MKQKSCIFICLILLSLAVIFSATAFSEDSPASAVTEPPAAPAAPAETSLPEVITPSLKTGMGGVISLDLRNIDVVDALKFLVMKQGLNIITTKSVSGRITLMVDNTPVKDVFDIMLRSNNLAYDKTGDLYNVMTQDEYKALYGKSFADIREVKLFRLTYSIPEQVFSVFDMLKSNVGRVLVDTESGSVIVMDSPDRIKLMEQILGGFEQKNVVRIFKLNYVRAAEVEEILKTQLDLKKVGLVKADERNNQVMVQTLPERMKQIEEIIGNLDRKTKEIYIDSQIIKVKFSDTVENGFEWEGLFDLGRKFGMTYLGSTPFASVSGATDTFTSRQAVLDQVGYVGSYPFSGTTGNSSASKPSIGLGQMHLGVVGKNDFDTVIHYLQTLSNTRIISNPKLAVVNNQEAKIHVGEKQAYVTTTTTTGQSSNTVSEQVNFVDVGVMLSVVPTINYDDYITLKVKAEINEVISTLITPTKNQIPIIDTSLAETTVMVKDGSSVIIGGLRKEQDIKTSQRTPFLGSIPLLGKLFSVDTKTKERTELMIILTPRLITGDVLIAQANGRPVGEDGTKSVKEYKDLRKQNIDVSSSDTGVETIFDKNKLAPKGLKLHSQ